MEQEVIFNVGVSGSGKTTWTTDFIKNNRNYLRINRDDIRKTLVGSLDGYYQRKDLNTIEALVTKMENHLGEHALNCGYNVIIDNTNLSSKTINEKLKAIDKYNKYYSKKVQFRFKMFPVDDVWTLKARVGEREPTTNLDYIDKQLGYLPLILKFINDNFKPFIINEKGS